MCRRAGIERKLASRVDQRVLRWFGHVKRMDEHCMARRVLMAEASAGHPQSRLTEVRFDGWCEGCLGQQRDDCGGCSTTKHRKEWRALVHM